MTRPNLEALRDLGPVGVLVRSGAKPSSRKGRYSPCPMCGAPDVQVGRVVWTCHRCGVSLDAPATAKALGGGTWDGAMVWAGVDTSGPWVAPARPLVLDWSPVWTWTTRRKLPQFWSPGLPWGGDGDAPFEPDPHDLAWARFRRHEPGGPWRLPRARLALASAREGEPRVRVAWGLEAVAGREAVGMAWDSLLDWGGGA